MDVTREEGRTVYRLGQFTYETATVVVDGEEHACWVLTNGRYRRDVQKALDSVQLTYLRDSEAPSEDRDEADPTKQPPWERWENARLHAKAWDEYLTACATVLIPTLTRDQAQLIEPEELTALFEEVGFFQKAPTTEATVAAPLGPTSTGATPKPASPTPIPAST
jgi:hypothetical protein